jgi:hypothetical protein
MDEHAVVKYFGENNTFRIRSTTIDIFSIFKKKKIENNELKKITFTARFHNGKFKFDEFSMVIYVNCSNC